MGKLPAASASYQAQATSSSESLTDRFSDLPDDVAHLILSPLPFKDLTRVGSVSKRCRQLHLSVPVVDFATYWSEEMTVEDDRTRSEIIKTHQENKVRVTNSWDRYLFYRGDNRLQRFCMDWHFYPSETNEQLSDDTLRVTRWVRNALKCKVEELHLRIFLPDNTFSLPSCVFLSQSLRSLSVEMRKQILEAPSLSFSSNLHCLILKDVKIVDERFFKWISCSCKCIKKLRLYGIKGARNITIESSSLEYIFCSIVSVGDLEHLNISGEKLECIYVFQETSSKSLKIFAPNLKRLMLQGNMWCSQNLGKLTSLEEAWLCLKPRVNEFYNVFGLLCSICSAKVLTISAETIEAFMEGSMAAPRLDNICKLKARTWNLNDDLVPALVSLLRGMPNLKILYISTNPFCRRNASGFGTEFWKMQNLAFVHQLEEVTIEPCGGSNRTDFAQYILEHALNLKKMVFPPSVDSYQSKAEAEIVRRSRSKMISTSTVIIRK